MANREIVTITGEKREYAILVLCTQLQVWLFGQDQSNEVDQWVQGTESFSSSSDLTGFWWFIGMYQVPVCSVACGVNAYLISMLVGRMRRLHTSLW